MVSAATFGLWEEAFDLRFQYRRKSSRCQRSRVSGWTSDVRLFPCSNHSCQEDEEHSIRLRACWPFYLALENDELLSQEGVFCHQLGLASAKIGQGLERQGSSERCGPLKKASSEELLRRSYELLETRQYHSELLLEKDAFFLTAMRAPPHTLPFYPGCSSICNESRESLSLSLWLFLNGCAK